MTSLQLGGYDPLDARLVVAAVSSPRHAGRAPSRFRLAGWSTSSVPAASLLLAGLVIGPRGISLLSPGVLSVLDPAIPVALAALAALVGMGLQLRERSDGRVLAIASASAGITTLIVAGAVLLVLPSLSPERSIPPLSILAGALGLCAASSLAVPGQSSSARRSIFRQLVDLEAIPPIVAGGALLAILHDGWALSAFIRPSLAIVMTLLLSGGAWLLLARATSETEQRVFALAAMLLVGGIADFLSLSALFGGFVAGIFWQLANGQPREAVYRDTLYIQHSLIVLVLVVAGARADVSLASFALAVAYLASRMLGRQLSALFVRRLSGTRERSGALQALSPGILGVALALDLIRGAGPDASVLLGTVVLGTIGSEIVAALWPRDSTAAEVDAGEEYP